MTSLPIDVSLPLLSTVGRVFPAIHPDSSRQTPQPPNKQPSLRLFSSHLIPSIPSHPIPFSPPHDPISSFHLISLLERSQPPHRLPIRPSPAQHLRLHSMYVMYCKYNTQVSAVENTDEEHPLTPFHPPGIHATTPQPNAAADGDPSRPSRTRINFASSFRRTTRQGHGDSSCCPHSMYVWMDGWMDSGTRLAPWKVHVSTVLYFWTIGCSARRHSTAHTTHLLTHCTREPSKQASDVT